MDKSDYWIEAVLSALDAVDKLELFTESELKLIAEDIATSADQESMAYGSSVAENPLTNEIKELKEKHKQELHQFEQRDEIFRKYVADRHGPYVSVNDVYTENGSVYYDRKGL